MLKLDKKNVQNHWNVAQGLVALQTSPSLFPLKLNKNNVEKTWKNLGKLQKNIDTLSFSKSH